MVAKIDKYNSRSWDIWDIWVSHADEMHVYKHDLMSSCTRVPLFLCTCVPLLWVCSWARVTRPWLEPIVKVQHNTGGKLTEEGLNSYYFNLFQNHSSFLLWAKYQIVCHLIFSFVWIWLLCWNCKLWPGSPIIHAADCILGISLPSQLHNCCICFKPIPSLNAPASSAPLGLNTICTNNKTQLRLTLRSYWWAIQK